MRILDRYATKQLLPVWIWCILVFLCVTVLIDLFEHLEEILRYHIPARTVVQYYLNFLPLVFVRASPLALLLSSAFIATRLVRYHELLAMHASGLSLIRASVPFLFVGWLVSVLVFVVNERVVPTTSSVYERIRHEAFRGQKTSPTLENVAIMDSQNRLYHARLFDTRHNELTDLTVLEHDAQSRPLRSLYARRTIYTPHGWLLLYGTISKTKISGQPPPEPEPFLERLIPFPVTPESFRQPETAPDTMRASELRQLIRHLKHVGITDVRRYRVELASKVTLPLMNLILCFIGFVGSTRRQTKGHLLGLGTSLGWGMLYYIGVAISHGIGKAGFLPVTIAVWLPHVVAVGSCLRTIRRVG